MSGEKNQGVGALIGSIIIVLLLLVGGYFSIKTGRTLSGSIPTEQFVSTSTTEIPVKIINLATSTPVQKSTAIKDIEADVKQINPKSLDPGLDNLDLLIQQEDGQQ